jgi:hypothetical protein
MNGADEIAEILESLHDIRLPPDAAGGIWSDIAAAFALGLLIAWALTGLIRLFTTRVGREHRSAVSLLEAARALPPQERLSVIASVMQKAAGDRDWLEEIGESGMRSALDVSLYSRGVEVDVDALHSAAIPALKRLERAR